MKRVIMSSTESELQKCNAQVEQISRYLEMAKKKQLDYENTLGRREFGEFLEAVKSASRESAEFRSYIAKFEWGLRGGISSQDINYFLDIHDAFEAEISDDYDTLRRLQDEARDRIAKKSAGSKMKKFKLTGSEQYAVEIAKQLMSQGESLEDAVYEACGRVSYRNAEPEYADEEFYEDEPDPAKVLKYLQNNLME